MTTTTTVQKTGTTHPGSTSKAKPAIAADLGMRLADLEAMSIAWVPVPLNDKDKELVRRVCIARSTDTDTVKVHAVLSRLAVDAFAKARPAMEEEAKAIAKRMSVELTEEDIEAKMKRLQNQLALAQQALAMRKAAK